jgi:hypothetical protein
MKFEYYLQKFNKKFPILTSNISINLQNYYVGQDIKTGNLSKEELITIALNEIENDTKGFWNVIIKLDIEEASDLYRKLGEVIDAYGEERQIFKGILPSDHIKP